MGLLLFFGLMLLIVIVLGFTLIVINDFEKKVLGLLDRLSNRYSFNPETNEPIDTPENIPTDK